MGALDWADKYLSLEILDSEWKNVLNKIKELSKEPKPKGIAAEQILVYFIYRHLADGMYDGSFEQRLRFALLSLNMIFAAAGASSISLAEAARLYSSEIEYSEENIESLLRLL